MFKNPSCLLTEFSTTLRTTVAFSSELFYQNISYWESNLMSGVLWDNGNQEFVIFRYFHTSRDSCDRQKLIFQDENETHSNKIKSYE